MRANKSVGCVSIILLCFVLGLISLLVGRMFLIRSQEPTFIIVRVDTPESVLPNEPFEVHLTIQNIASEEILLHSIDVSNSYFDAIAVNKISPEPTREQSIPIVNFRSYRFEKPIMSGGTQSVVFELIGAEEGLYEGEIDICVEASVLCKLVEVRTVIGDGNGR